jgi:hypothetical protein
MRMKNKHQQSVIMVIGIVIILIAVLSRRLFIRNYSIDSTLTFLAGFALIFLSFLILRIILKKKK